MRRAHRIAAVLVTVALAACGAPTAPTGSLANMPSYEVSSWCGGFTFPDSITGPDSAGIATAHGAWRSQVTWTFVSTKTAADSQAAVRCLARVVTHEIGHALGIV